MEGHLIYLLEGGVLSDEHAENQAVVKVSVDFCESWTLLGSIQAMDGHLELIWFRESVICQLDVVPWILGIELRILYIDGR